MFSIYEFWIYNSVLFQTIILRQLTQNAALPCLVIFKIFSLLLSFKPLITASPTPPPAFRKTLWVPFDRKQMLRTLLKVWLFAYLSLYLKYSLLFKVSKECCLLQAFYKFLVWKEACPQCGKLPATCSHFSVLPRGRRVTQLVCSLGRTLVSVPSSPLSVEAHLPLCSSTQWVYRGKPSQGWPRGWAISKPASLTDLSHIVQDQLWW